MNTISSIILSVSILLSSFVLGSYYYDSKMIEKRYVKSVGLATKRFTSDIVRWDLTIKRWTPWDKIEEGYKNIQQDKESLISYLYSKGFEASDISLKQVVSYNTVNEKNNITGYNISQQISITSKNVTLLESLAQNPTELIDKKINIQYSDLSYFYSQIDELKKELLSDAATNAKERAEEMIKNSDLKVGILKSARAGVFQITRENSNDFADYGIHDTMSKNREIRVTVHVEFELR